MAATTERAADTKARVLSLCRRLVPRATDAGSSGRAVRVIIVGVPNVGKSTLINTLAGRRVAKVGDEPAVTKSAQQVVLDGGVVLSDNPGILWAKLEDEAASYRLALAGALPDTAIDFESVALFGAAFLLRRYPALVLARYGLTAPPDDALALLTAIGKRRGAIRAGGTIDLHKAGDHLIHDFRSGVLGRISLEEP
jgi:ribosome biogenesis GTPase A